MTARKPRPTAPKITATLETVTPEIAAEWIAKNLNNRNVRSSVVAGYARDMAAGAWRVTGEAIKFDNAGTMIDGQHRLLAIIQSGATVQILVIRGLAPEVQEAMDSGAKRTAGDALTWSGYKHGALVAAIARLGMEIEQGSGTKKFTNAELIEWLDDNPDAADAASAISGMKKYLPMRPAAAGYAFVLLCRADHRACAEFFDSLAFNRTNGKGDPRSTLLRRLGAARDNKERLHASTEVRFVIRAWNAWRRGETLHVLRTRNSSGSVESVSMAASSGVAS